MINSLFFLLNAINFILILVYLAIGGKLIFKSNSPLNGSESIIVSLFIFASCFLAFMSGIEADQSHHFLEYQKIVNVKAASNFLTPNLYEYYPLNIVIGKTLFAFSLIAGSSLYSYKKQEKRYARNKKRMTEEEHQGWESSLKTILKKRRGNGAH